MKSWISRISSHHSPRSEGKKTKTSVKRDMIGLEYEERRLNKQRIDDLSDRKLSSVETTSNLLNVVDRSISRELIDSVINVKGDGNCGFRAVAHYVKGNEED